MIRGLIFVTAAGLALSGCCLDANGCFIQPQARVLVGWNGLDPLPKRHKVNRAKKIPKTSLAESKDSSPSEDELTKLKPYSKEWTAVFDTMNRAADDELKRKLVICRDCMPPEPDDRTGAITAGGYLSVRR